MGEKFSAFALASTPALGRVADAPNDAVGASPGGAPGDCRGATGRRMELRAKDEPTAGGSAPSAGRPSEKVVMPELLTWKEVAAALRLSDAATAREVRAHLQRLGVPIVRLNPKSWRVRRDALAAAIERAECEAGS